MKEGIKRLILLLFRKRVYLLVLRSFIGPFLVTFFLLEIVFLTWHMIKYKDDFAGKGLDLSVYLEIIYYFAFHMVPRVLPFTVMVSSLITYGNLGEHNELTAIKSAGISMSRLLTPVFIVVVGLSIACYFFNDQIVPKMNLKAYSLLYDVRMKKPALNIREGVFYQDIDGYRIRAAHIAEDGETMKDVLIYDHSDGTANTQVIAADSGKMIMDESETYLTFDLYHGQRHAENTDKKNSRHQEYTRTKFDHSRMIFDLSSLKLGNTPEHLFSKNKYMLSIRELSTEIDSLRLDIALEHQSFKNDWVRAFRSGIIIPDSLKGIKKEPKYTLEPIQRFQALNTSYSIARSVMNVANSKLEYIRRNKREISVLGVEKLHKYTDSAAIIVMFIIGASLGAVLKKGGMGLPMMTTVLFFVLYYFISTSMEKLSKQDIITYQLGTWFANMVLFPISLFFLYQAYRDARLFEFGDFGQRILSLFKKNKKSKA